MVATLLNVSLKDIVFDISDETSSGGVIVDSETWLEQTLVKVLVIVIIDKLAGVLGHVTVETIVYSLVVVVKDVPPVQISHDTVEILVVWLVTVVKVMLAGTLGQELVETLVYVLVTVVKVVLPKVGLVLVVIWYEENSVVVKLKAGVVLVFVVEWSEVISVVVLLWLDVDLLKVVLWLGVDLVKEVKVVVV